MDPDDHHEVPVPLVQVGLLWTLLLQVHHRPRVHHLLLGLRPHQPHHSKRDPKTTPSPFSSRSQSGDGGRGEVGVRECRWSEIAVLTL